MAGMVTTSPPAGTSSAPRCFSTRLKQHNDRDYAKVVLRHPDGKTANLKVHRLVARAFLESPSRDKTDNLRSRVNHIDGNKLNNKVANLEWCSAAENSHYEFAEDGEGIQPRRGG